MDRTWADDPGASDSHFSRSTNVALPLLLHPLTARCFLKSSQVATFLKQFPSQVKLEQDWDKNTYQPFLVDHSTCQPLPLSSLLASLVRELDVPSPLQQRVCSAALECVLLKSAAKATNEIKPATARKQSLVSSLLLQSLDHLPTNAQSLQVFLEMFERLLSSQSPMSISLSSTEAVYFQQIAQLCVQVCASPSALSHLEEKDAAFKTSLRSNVVRFWLGRGSMHECLQAVQFLLAQRESMPIGAYLESWRSAIRVLKRRVVRVSQAKHFTEVGGFCRRVGLCRASREALRPKRPLQGRKWDWEDDSGWTRYDDRVSKILESAYQTGKPFVDFQVDSRPDTYRADLEKMTQRNLATGKERGLRSLLAISIKGVGTRLSQAVEINMPHDAMILDLRKELAAYLKHDERMLRVSAGNVLLKRADFMNVSIRDGIVPLGSEPLVVTKLKSGEIEERCTFVLTGQKAVPQPFFHCTTCQLNERHQFCGVCAIVCHKGHTLLPLGKKPGFCMCGAGTGPGGSTCRALEESPVDADKCHGPAMCSDSKAFLYILTPEHGLMKMGTGWGGTVTGQVYQQETRLAVHAGGQLAFWNGVLLLRSPMLAPNVLLQIDPDTMKTKPERLVLYSDGQAEDGKAYISSLSSQLYPGSGTAEPSSWTLQYCVRSELHIELDDQEEGDVDFWGTTPYESTLDQHGAEWRRLPASFVAKVKDMLVRGEWQYGDVCLSDEGDHIRPSLILEEQGLIFRRYAEGAIQRSRVRIKHSESVLPIFACGEQLMVMSLCKIESKAVRDVPISEAKTEAGKEEKAQEEQAQSRGSDNYCLFIQSFSSSALSSVHAVTYCFKCGSKCSVDTDKPLKCEICDAPPPPLPLAVSASASVAKVDLPSSTSSCSSASAFSPPGSPPLRPSQFLSPAAAASSTASSSFSASPSPARTAFSSVVSSYSELSSYSESPSVAAGYSIDHFENEGDDSFDVNILLDQRNGSVASPISSTEIPTASETTRQLSTTISASTFLADGTPFDSASSTTVTSLATTSTVAATGVATMTTSFSTTTTLTPTTTVDALASDRAATSANASTTPTATTSTSLGALDSTAPSNSDIAGSVVLNSNFAVDGKDAIDHNESATIHIALPISGYVSANPNHRPVSESPNVPPLVEVPSNDSSSDSAEVKEAVAASSATSTKGGPMYVVQFRGCSPSGPRTCLEVNIDFYRETLIRPSKRVYCDGCGLSHRSGESPLFVCLDKSCRDVYLCKFCHLMGKWHASSHSHVHDTEPVPNDEQVEEQLVLPYDQFVAYWDPVNKLVVTVRHSPSAESWLRSVSGFDATTGKTVFREATLKTRGDSFCYDSTSGAVWAYSVYGQRLERWRGLSLIKSDPATPDLLHPVAAASVILQELVSVSSAPGFWATAFELACDVLSTLVSTGEEVAVPAVAHALTLIKSFFRRPLPRAFTLAATLLPSLRALLEDRLLGGFGKEPVLPKTMVSQDDTIIEQACAVWVDGFELFYPNWKDRTTRVRDLVISKTPVAARVLELLSVNYRELFLGLRVGLFREVQDPTLFASHVQRDIQFLLRHIAKEDLGAYEAGQKTVLHPLTYFLLCVLSQLGNFALQQAQCDSHPKGGLSSPAKKSEADIALHRSHAQSGFASVVKIAANVFSLCVELFEKIDSGTRPPTSLPLRTQSKKSALLQTARKPEQAEEVLSMFDNFCVGMMLPWCVAWLQQIQVIHVPGDVLCHLATSSIDLIVSYSSLVHAALPSSPMFNAHTQNLGRLESLEWQTLVDLSYRNYLVQAGIATSTTKTADGWRELAVTVDATNSPNKGSHLSVQEELAQAMESLGRAGPALFDTRYGLLESLKLCLTSILAKLFHPAPSVPAKTPSVAELSLEDQVNRTRPAEDPELEPSFDQDVIFRLVESADRWQKDLKSKMYKTFLEKFIESKAIFVPHHALMTSLEPADALSMLVHKCLTDMGGGYAQLALMISASDPYRTEKCFVAAWLKHSGALGACFDYCRSLAIFELLNSAQAKGTRCLAQPSCPPWLKAVVKATFADIRTTTQTLLTAARDRLQNEGHVPSPPLQEIKEEKKDMPEWMDPNQEAEALKRTAVSFLQTITANSTYILSDFTSDAFLNKNDPLAPEPIVSEEESSSEEEEEPLTIFRVQTQRPNLSRFVRAESETEEQFRYRTRRKSASTYTPSATRALSAWIGEDADSKPQVSAPDYSKDMKWITCLATSALPLGRAFSISIRNLQTAMTLRNSILQEINKLFQTHCCELADDVLPLVAQLRVVADVQHAVSFRSWSKETDDTLLFFYKHLVQALQSDDLTRVNSRLWLRSKTILHFFCAEFQPQDCDIILSSGMLSVLSRFGSSVERVLAQEEKQTERSLATRLRVWISQISMYLAKFLLSCASPDKRQRYVYALASSEGPDLISTLLKLLTRIAPSPSSSLIPSPASESVFSTLAPSLAQGGASTGSLLSVLWPLQLENPHFEQLQDISQKVAYAIDILDVLTQIAVESPVCSTEQLLFLIRTLQSYPVPVRISLLNLFAKELTQHTSDSRIVEELVVAYGDGLLPYRILKGECKLEQKVPTVEVPLEGPPSVFRRIACLICSGCLYIDFLTCKTHRCLLTLETCDGEARCAQCPSVQHKIKKCEGCKQPKCELHFLLLSQDEAGYCEGAMTNEQHSQSSRANRSGPEQCIIAHNLLQCEVCKVIEFPGTSDGGQARLTLNVEGRLFDQKSRKCIELDSYSLRHFTPSCPGKVFLRPVRLAADRAFSLALIANTKPLSTTKHITSPWVWQSSHPTERGVALVTDILIDIFRLLINANTKGGWSDVVSGVVRTGLQALPSVLEFLSKASWDNEAAIELDKKGLLKALWSLDLFGADRTVLRAGIDVEGVNGVKIQGPILHLDVALGLAALTQCEAPIELLNPTIRGGASRDFSGKSKILSAIFDCLRLSPPSNPVARLCFSHLQTSVLKMLSAQPNVLGGLIDPSALSAALLTFADQQKFGFGASAAEVMRTQSTIHGFLLSLCSDVIPPKQNLISSLVAPGGSDVSVVAPKASEPKKNIPEGTPVIVQSLDQMVAMGFSSAVSRYALAAGGGSVEVATGIILGGEMPDEDELDEGIVNQNWETLLDRLGLREAVEAHYHRLEIQEREAKSEGLSGPPKLFLAHHQWPSASDTHFVKEKASWLGVSEAESQEAAATMLAMKREGTLLHSRVLITKQAAKFWRFSKGKEDSGEKQYRVGDKLVIYDLVNKVCHAEVVEVKEFERTIYIHYTGWSKKWDEWVSTSSKRIMPSFKVGDRLVVLDLSGKECDVLVSEVSIRDNALKLLIHYTGRLDKHDEWILANNNKRIISKPKPTPTAEQRSTDVPSVFPFELSGRIGTIVKIDDRTQDEDQLVLVEASDEQKLHATLFLWIKLISLRPVPLVVRPPSTCHFPLDPQVCVLRSQPFPELLAQAVEVQLATLSFLASDLLYSLVRKHPLLLSLEDTIHALGVSPGCAWLHSSENSLRKEFIVQQERSLLSCKAFGHHSNPSSTVSSDATDTTTLVSNTTTASTMTTTTSPIVATSSASIANSSSTITTATSTLGATSLSLSTDIAPFFSLVSSYTSLPPPCTILSTDALSSTSRTDFSEGEFPLQNIVFTTNVQNSTVHISSTSSSFVTASSLEIKSNVSQNQLQKCIESSSEALLKACAPIGLVEIPLNAEGVTSVHVADFDLQLISLVSLNSTGFEPDRNMFWELSFYSDKACTTLLRTVVLSGNTTTPWGAQIPAVESNLTQSFQVAPFVVPSPVYITSSVLHLTLLGKKDREKPSCRILPTPFSCRALEAMQFLVRMLIRVRRELPKNYSGSCDELLLLCYDKLVAVLNQLDSPHSVPSNIKVCVLEMLAQLLLLFAWTNGFEQKTSDDADETVPELVSADAPSPSSTPAQGPLKSLNMKWVNYAAAEMKSQLHSEKGPMFSVYTQRLAEILLCALRISSEAAEAVQGIPAMMKLKQCVESVRAATLNPAHWPNQCGCAGCVLVMEKQSDNLVAMLLMDVSSESIWPALWREIFPNAANPIHDFLTLSTNLGRWFDAVLDVSQSKQRSRPEIAFVRSTTQTENMFTQLCDAFWKLKLHVRPAPLRTELGAVTWKTVLAGDLDQGAAGLPGPFRQALFEISAVVSPQQPSDVPSTLFLPCPNNASQTGSDRNKLIVNPGFVGEEKLRQCRVFGQLIGVAIRSKSALDLDLAECVWKMLLGEPLVTDDLKSVDYTFWLGVQFQDPTGAAFGREEFDNYFSHLTFTVVLSDGTSVELRPGGSQDAVAFEDRWEYARLAVEARLYESALPIRAMREGLLSVVPLMALSLLSPSELELRVCGRPTVDVEVLKKHTVYSPSAYSETSPEVIDFWQVISEFTDAERGQFLQFAWARSRLPSELNSFRMQLHIVEPRGSAIALPLPTAETCFFNVHLPKYPNIQVLKQKLRLAMACVTITS